MPDKIEQFDYCVIQHGKYNDRVYLMKLIARDQAVAVITQIEELARQYQYSKIFGKIPTVARETFLANGYREEAFIPKFFDGQEDVHFMAKYLLASRQDASDDGEIKKIIECALAKKNSGAVGEIPPRFQLRIAEAEDVTAMAEVYRQVFPTYPFPIFDPDYLLDTMRSHIVYFCIREGEKIVALSSCEMGYASNVEMTDFATLPPYRGNNLAVYLLTQMEQEMRSRGIHTAYTIARACSYGMNITFAKLGYHYSGTLINNTNISGKMESMNVWYKHLSVQDNSSFGKKSRAGCM